MFATEVFWPSSCNAVALCVPKGWRVMSAYHVNFFKYLLSSDGHPFKCLQWRIDINDAQSPTQAAESASRAFETLYGCSWTLRADSIEVENADSQ